MLESDNRPKPTDSRLHYTSEIRHFAISYQSLACEKTPVNKNENIGKPHDPPQFISLLFFFSLILLAYKPTPTKKWPPNKAVYIWPTPTEDWNLEKQEEEPKRKLNILMIAGIAGGAVAVIIIVVIVVVLVVKRKKYRLIKKKTDLDDISKVMLDNPDTML